MHILCGIRGVVHSFDMTKAEVHDIHYLKDIKCNYNQCVILADKAYLSKEYQMDLFHSSQIRPEVPMRSNQHGYRKQHFIFRKSRKRIETLFSQLCDQFMIRRNYAKDTAGIFTRILSKITAVTALQYLNKSNDKNIGHIKYALF